MRRKKQAFERERQEARDQESRNKELKLARATALALYPRYLAAAAVFHVALEHGRYWHPSDVIDEPTSFEDRKLLAAHMSRRDRELVVRAEIMMQRTIETRRRSDEWSEKAAEAIRDSLGRVESAWRALKTFGETDS